MNLGEGRREEENLGGRFPDIYRRFLELAERVSDELDSQSGQLLGEVLQELSAAVEELEVGTEEIQAQNEALEAAQSKVDLEVLRYRELFEGAPDGYLVSNDQGIIVEVNRAAADLLGASAQLLHAKPLIVFIDPANRRTVLTALHQVLYGRLPATECEILFAPPNRRPFAASVHIVASGANGAMQRTVRWLIRDESRRVAAEEALAREQARYRLVANSFSDVVISTDEHGLITYASPSTESALGYQPADLEGREMSQFLHPDDWGVLAALEEQSHARDTHPSGVLRVIRRSRERVPMEVTVVRTSGQEGKAVGRTYTMHDVHDREESRLALQTALARERHAAIALREADAAKDALILGASHDLSSPVAAVAGLADQLVRHPDLSDGEVRRMAEGLAAAGSKLRDILTNLLDAERVLGGHVHVRSQPTDVQAIALAAVRAHGLPAACLQPARGPVLAEVDSGLTERIADNVIGNALRHTPPGTPIRVNLDTHEGEVVLSVVDRGPGVADDAKETIFEPFQRGGPRSAGLGLGLFVVRRFAELQGGHAWVADTDGGGATFRVSFAAVGAAG